MTKEIRGKISEAWSGPRNPNWAGGSWADRHGRVYVRVPPEERHLHPTIRQDGYIKRYAYNWNRAHPEDPLTRGFVLHHINHDKTDDRVENLVKMTQSEHASLHFRGVPKSEETRARMRAAWVVRKAKAQESA